MGKLGNDFRQALRVATHQKSVTVMAIVAFALGIGITTAVFSIFNAVLLAPLPFPDPEQVVAVFDTQPACATCPASYPKYHDWKDRNQVFSAIGGSTQASFVMTGASQPEQLIGSSTTASLNDVFRRCSDAGIPPRRISRARPRWSSCRTRSGCATSMAIDPFSAVT